MKTIVKGVLLVIVDIIISISVLWLIFSQTIYSLSITVLAIMIGIVVITITHDIITKTQIKK